MFAPSSTWETRSVLAPSLSPFFQPLLPSFPPSVFAVHLRLSSSVRFRLRSLSLSLSVFPALLFLLLPRLRGQNINDRANHPKHEHRPPLDAKKEEKRVTAASWPSVGSGVERWANACTGQDAFLVGVGSRPSRRNGLTVFVHHPPPTSTLRSRLLFVGIRWFRG